MASDDNNIYDSSHTIEIVQQSGQVDVRNVLIRVKKQPNHLLIKLRDANDFAINYTSCVDFGAFETMKAEQCLEICYDEFHGQLLDLLRQTSNREMLLKLERNEAGCKMIFYERSKIKCLIFLTVHLNLTNQREIIDEMSINVAQLKEINRRISSQIAALKTELQQKEASLETALKTNRHLEITFIKDIKRVEEAFVENLLRIEDLITEGIDAVWRKYAKLERDVEVLKRATEFKQTLYKQTLLDLDGARTENLRQSKLVEELTRKVESANAFERQSNNLVRIREAEIAEKSVQIESLNAEISELRKDNSEAAKLVAQKSRAHDEIAGDLVQANKMLVEFSARHETLLDEVAQLKRVATAQERAVEDQQKRMRTLTKNFDDYRKTFNEEDFGKARSELFRANARVEELEKQNREAVKINTLLTKKLAHGEGYVSANCGQFSKGDF